MLKQREASMTGFDSQSGSNEGSSLRAEQPRWAADDGSRRDLLVLV